MEIMDLIEQLRQLVDNAKAPLLGREQILINKREIEDIVDKLMSNLPTEIKKAQWIIDEEKRIASDAQAEHDHIIADARARAEMMVEQTEIYRQAQATGEEIVAHAQRQAHEITEGAFMYAHDIMEKLENQLTVYYEVIQEGRSEIQRSLEAMQGQTFAPEENFAEE